MVVWTDMVRAWMVVAWSLVLYCNESECKRFNGNDTKFCTKRDTQKCILTIKNIARYEAIKFAKNKIELMPVCRKYVKSLKCMDKYSLECLDQEKRTIIQNFMSGPKKFIMKICNAGSYQRNFLKLAPCFNARNKTFGATKCTDILARKQKQITKLLSRKKYKQNRSAREKKFSGNLCQALFDFRNCSRGVVLQHCGKSNADFYDVILMDITAPLVESACAKPTSSSTMPNSITVQFSLVIVISCLTNRYFE